MTSAMPNGHESSKSRRVKKSDSIEARLSHDLKVAFMARCEADSRSASDVLRGLIASYLASPERHQTEARPVMKPIILKHLLGAAGLGAVAIAAHAGAITGADAGTHFAAVDLNKDGAVTLSELKSAHASAGASHRPPASAQAPHGGASHGSPMAARHSGHDRAPHDAVLGEAFARRDANGDGTLDPTEFEGLGSALAERAFAMLDTDANSAIDQAELKQAHGGSAVAASRGIDRDGNGTISLAEFTVAPAHHQ